MLGQAAQTFSSSAPTHRSSTPALLRNLAPRKSLHFFEKQRAVSTLIAEKLVLGSHLALNRADFAEPGSLYPV